MTLRWQCVCVDSTDPRRAADFWQSALGWRRTHESDEEVVLEPPEGSPQFCVLRPLSGYEMPNG